jgi:ATP-dependent Clp protease adapter protein ClpS
MLWNTFAPVRIGATQHARTLDHIEVNESHLAMELLKNEPLRELAKALGNEVEDIELLVEGSADETPDMKWYSLAIRAPTRALRAIYARAYSNAFSAELDAVTPGLLLLCLINAQPQSRVADRLAVFGFEPLPVRLYFAHGRLDDPPLPRGSGSAHVVALNDPFSTMELVVELFETIIGLQRDEAIQAMHEVHREGEAIVATLPWTDARRMGEAIRREARRRHYPLDVRIEPA